MKSEDVNLKGDIHRDNENGYRKSRAEVKRRRRRILRIKATIVGVGLFGLIAVAAFLVINDINPITAIFNSSNKGSIQEESLPEGVVEFKIAGYSMEPTLKNGTVIRCDKNAFVSDTAKRADLIIFQNPDDTDKISIGRIIGCPGEEIYISQGLVYVNEKLLDEKYVGSPIDINEHYYYIIPENCYFVMGDNRAQAFDSRFWQCPFVSSDKIIAKVIQN